MSTLLMQHLGLKSKQIQNWHELLQSTKPLVDEALKEYETACRQSTRKELRVAHQHLPENLRARLNERKGTCEAFWYYQTKQDTSDSHLATTAERAYVLVTRFRTFEILFQRVRTEPEDNFAWIRARQSYIQISALQIGQRLWSG